MKIAIIGANEFQNKLVLKAKELGYETHVFAWEEGAVAKENSDFFYPISIVNKEEILNICKKVNIDGICSIASDLAMLTVNYVADKLNLVGNSLETTKITTDKYEMRLILEKNKIPVPKFFKLNKLEEEKLKELKYPIIIKPTDRSGSRGVYKINTEEELKRKFELSQKVSFSNEVILEEYIGGKEYSVESISQNGIHKIIQITKKYTTKNSFIEIAHEQPATLEEKQKLKINDIVIKSLTALKIENGAAHTELKIDGEKIKIIEIGGRMGGDFIGSDLVKISTGIDYLKLVLDVAIGKKIKLETQKKINYSFIRFILDECDKKKIESLDEKYKKMILEKNTKEKYNLVTDSSTRNGFYIFSIPTKNDLNKIKEKLL